MADEKKQAEPRPFNSVGSQTSGYPAAGNASGHYAGSKRIRGMIRKAEQAMTDNEIKS